MTAKDRLIFGIVLVWTCLEIVQSSSIRSENVGSTDPPIALPYEMSSENLHSYLEESAMEYGKDYEIIDPIHIKGSRRKRHAESARDIIEYRLTAFGEEYWLVLKHNERLMTSGCVIEKHVNGIKVTSSCVKTNYNESNSEISSDDDCFYLGYSRSHSNSFLSMALCYGLHGIISVPERDHDLIVQPIREDPALRSKRSTTDSYKHLIYRQRRQGDFFESATKVTTTTPQLSRRKRSSDKLFIEALLVADQLVSEKHGEGVRNHLLTIANMVSGLLIHPSLETYIRFSVMKIRILGNGSDEAEKNMGSSLHTFCELQENLNSEDDSNPNHFDTAALFTTHKIRNLNNALGEAFQGGMCDSKKRCSVVKDVDLSAGWTLTHETGHLLGMGHDMSTPGCPNYYRVMARETLGTPTAYWIRNRVSWSNCSVVQLERFLSNNGECLHDKPEYGSPPQGMPGELYNGVKQCWNWLGDGWTLKPTSNCRQLTCKKRNRPRKVRKTTSNPPLDGTRCGNRKHCMQGMCVDKS